MFEILGSGGIGLISGLVGGVVQKIYAYKEKKLDREIQVAQQAHEIALRRVDAEIMAQEWTQRVRVAETEGDLKAFNTALTSEPKRFAEGPLTPKQTWLMVILDFVRGAIRPGLTIYLSVLATLVYLEAAKLTGGFIVPDQSYALLTRVIDMVLQLWATATMFWFGTRMTKGK